MSNARYAMFASAFAWVPGVFCVASSIAASFQIPGKVSAGDWLFWLFLISGAAFLLFALVAVARSGRESRWVFVPLTCIPLGAAVWWLLLAASFSGGIYK